MYLLNRGYSLKVNDGLNIDGIIISASGLMLPEVERRNTPETELILFDPQMYFLIENNDTSTNTFCKLSTYPWYNQSPPKFDSSVIKITQYKKQAKKNNIHCHVSMPSDNEDMKNRITECIKFQHSIDTSYIILPSPLVVDAEDQFSNQLSWINSGLDICENYDKPVLATLAISENVLIHNSFETNSLVQTIIDNLSALNGVDGFYIVISRNNTNTNIIEKNIVQTVLELSYNLGKRINKKVFLNFMDNLGFLGLAAGAYAFGSGYTNKERRLNFSDFIDKDSGGAPLPHFYSYSLIGDFFTERDLNKIRNARLLKYIKNDMTPFSESLFKALKEKTPISSLTDWKETLNNVSTAKNHRAALMYDKISYLNSLDFEEKIEYTLGWLQDAEAAKLYFDNVFEDDPLSEDCRHVTVWRKCFEQFINKYNLI